MSPNRLANEQSPYLRQHADNPVNWYAWGEEAFAAAREKDRPIFLSIGYATCHWCHVMAHESFEDEEVAQLMNETLIPVKIDREERPDIDSVYMTVCQMMTGHGGWPLNVVLTPELEPFFAGTYFPRESRGGRIGMLDLVPRIRRLWTERRSEVEDSAAEITRALREATDVPDGELPGREEIDAAYHGLVSRYDSAHGGFGGAPKFPSPHNLTFLLRVFEASADERALEMVTTTLRAMRRGGMHDQLAGGFHRYSTDAEWRLPHFEKMLYDQALLALAYTEAWQATGETDFADTARRTLGYVLDELTDSAGGFHSAEDADSEGEEGRYYVWTLDEITRVLGDGPDRDLAVDAYGITEAGNFRDEASGERTGANVLMEARSAAELGERHDEAPGVISARLETIRRRLLEARRKRVRPDRDDKVLADWNGLTIAALARAGRAFEERRFVHAAVRAAEFLGKQMTGSDGEPLHRWRRGEAAIPAMLDDLAFVAWGHLELFEATYEPRWLESAVAGLERLVDRFEAPDGGFYQTAQQGEDAIVRMRPTSDGALPSGNSIGTLALLRAARLTGRIELEEAAFRALRALGGRVAASPAGHTALLQSVAFARGPTAEVVVVGPVEDTATRELLASLRHDFHPRVVSALKPSDDDETADRLGEIAPFTDGLTSKDGRATAYLCTDHVCEQPRTDTTELEEALSRV